MGDQLVGREADREVVGAALRAATGGEPRFVMVEGVAGVGKTALVSTVTAEHDAVALWARAEPIEQRLDFGVVDQLFRAAHAAGITAPPVLDRGGARPDPLAVGFSVLELIEAQGRHGPLTIVLDDADWADVASVEALAFAFRRLDVSPVAMIVIRRAPQAAATPFDRIVADGRQRGVGVHLDPLTVGDVAELASGRGGVAIGPAAAARLHRHTGGNPLEVLMLVDELPDEELTAGSGPLPAPRTFAAMVMNRLADCAMATEEVVSNVAVAGASVEISQLCRLCPDVDLSEALGDAVERGLLRVEQRLGRRAVDVAHPLIRSAVLDDLPLGRLSALHARAAEVASEPDRAVLHRLRSVIGEDTPLAAAAIESARVQLGEGWALAAVEQLDAAADVLPEGPLRNTALLLAAEGGLALGDVALSRSRLARVGDDGGPRERLVRGELAIHVGRDHEATAELRTCWELEPRSELAARAAALLATIATNNADAATALGWSREALRLGAELGCDAGFAATMLASAWALTGDLEAGERELAQWGAQLASGPSNLDVAFAHGLLSLWRGALAETIERLEPIAELGLGGGRGPLLTIASAQYTLADAWFRTGRWDEAVTLAETLAEWLDDADQPRPAPMAHSVAAFVHAARGNVAAADRHVETARHIAVATSSAAAMLWVETADARLAAARDRHDDVVRILEPFAKLSRDLPLPEGVQPFRADLIEALVAVDRVDDAVVELDELRRRVHGDGPARAGLARAAGLVAAALGDIDRADVEFAVGLDLGVEVVGAFEWARVALAAGSVQRRAGRRRRAERSLAAAETEFRRLGALPLLARTISERERCGLHRRTAHDSPPSQPRLTKAETWVAELIAAGRTNKEAADELTLSVRTVESHLGRIYVKFGVRSRSELTRAWPEYVLTQAKVP